MYRVSVGDKFRLVPPFIGKEDGAGRKAVCEVVGLYQYFALCEFAGGVKCGITYHALSQEERA